jgi:uncharacterized protein (DUF58 family)
MRRASFLVLLASFLFVLGMASRNGTVLAMMMVVIVYLAVAVYFRPGQPSLQAERWLDRSKVVPNTPVEMKVRVVNQGSLLEEVEVSDRTPAGLQVQDGRIESLSTLAPSEETELACTLQGKRGEYVFFELDVRSRETFGLFETTATIAATERLVIHPTPMKMKPVPIRPPQTRGFAGPIPSRQGGTGVDFLIVREYQPGDPLRQINWRVSARAENDLYTTIYEQQRIADVGIILDSREQCDIHVGDQSIFEHGVRAAGALSEIFLNDGNRVGLLVYGAAMTIAFPGMGKIQHERILQVLARAHTGFSYALERLDFLPTRFFPARSQVILISPLTTEDVSVMGFLRARGYAVLVISPNPILFEAGTQATNSSEELARRCAQAERDLMIQGLRRAGVQVVDWDVNQPLEPLVRAAIGSYRIQGAGIQ